MELDNSMSDSDSSIDRIKTGVLNLLSSDSETVDENCKSKLELKNK